MDYLQKKINLEIGNKLREIREAKGLTQEELAECISGLYVKEVIRDAKLTAEEAEIFEDYFNNDEWNDEMVKKLTKLEIKDCYRQIAISTISKYENGETTIPAYYIQLIKRIC